MSDRFSNFHTHTCLCDGKDTPEELVLRALELGCPALGFSGHSYAPYDEGYCMSVAQTAEYKAEIRRLQQKYTGRICIYMGIEQDFYSEAFTEGYDYVIGSVHYLRKNGAYLPVDASQAQQAQAVQDYYGGDWYAFAEDYYRTVAQVRERTGCRIVGHFDLVTKFNEGDTLFSTRHPRYIRAVRQALDALAQADVTFEINTGAIGYHLKDLNPCTDIIKRYRELGGEIITIGSDAHTPENIARGFDRAAEVLSACGFKYYTTFENRMPEFHKI